MPFRTSLAVLLTVPLTLVAEDVTRISPPGTTSSDARYRSFTDLNGYFPFTPPTTKEGWDTRKRQVREQLLVANGLWPLPEKTPINPTIHGKIERDGYTIEKVFFASMPGHYVSGNLYRPSGKIEGKRPGVLCPHGHWANGRFYEASDANAKKEIDSGAEQRMEGAKYPLQARCAQLARMGCVVFHYDMVGYADSQAIAHRVGFVDAEAELRLQNFMGLQTWNTLRALDFLVALPEVDANRIGVTGASGGGTQTFILGAIDDRPAVAFPAVMVSTAMQGGCICENCSYLRIGTGNVEIAGMFAPKPLAMSAANDWTLQIEEKGLPQLKSLYGLVGNAADVEAKCWPKFGHNYNQVAREMMYNWFQKHLLKREGEVKEQPFVPVPPKELSVYDEKKTVPMDALAAPELRKKMTAASDAQLAKLREKHADYRQVVLTALGVMIGDPWQAPVLVESNAKSKADVDGVSVQSFMIGRKASGEQVPTLMIRGKEMNGIVLVWVHPQGKASLFDNGKLIPAARKWIDGGGAIIAGDVFQTGELMNNAPKVNAQFAGYTYGYNKPLLSQRVHDIRTLTAFARSLDGAKQVHLVGWDKAGPWALLAQALDGNAVSRSAIDLNGFRFDSITKTDDEMMLPGAVKYGDIPGLLLATVPANMLVHHTEGTGIDAQTEERIRAASMGNKMTIEPKKWSMEQVIAALMK